MSLLDRYAVANNEYQGTFKKVLCICRTGILRSATAAYVFNDNPFNYNTRAAGVDEKALFRLEPVHIAWADEIICMEKEHERAVKFMQPENDTTPIYTLNIPDEYEYRDPTLIKLIVKTYVELTERKSS